MRIFGWAQIPYVCCAYNRRKKYQECGCTEKKACKNTEEYLQAKKSLTRNHFQHLEFVLLAFRTERIYILAQDCCKKITQYCLSHLVGDIS